MVSTLLGSCVAVTMWSERMRVGGMCHIVLPGGDCNRLVDDTRYAVGAISRFVSSVKKQGLLTEEIRVGVFGGGQMLLPQNRSSQLSIGEKNIAQTEACLEREGFDVQHREVGGYLYRNLTLDLNTGSVGMHRKQFAPPALLA